MKFLYAVAPLFLLGGCFSTWTGSPISGDRGLPETFNSVPNPEEFAKADLNKDSFIDLNESAEFFGSQAEVDYITPLIAIGLIIALVVVACSFSSIRFFFKNLGLRARKVYIHISTWTKNKFKK